MTARLLLVEPNRGALSVLAERLRGEGYRIVACETGVSAVPELYRLPVDLVIAELRMAVMSGVELTRLIRDDTVLRDTPVILITGRSDANGAVDALGAGADDVVAKPFDFEVLVARIERGLRRAKAVRALRDDNAALDARIVERALEVSDLKAQLVALQRA